MIYILGIFTALLVGVIAKLISDHLGSYSQITRNELIVGAIVCSLIVVPATVAIGTHIAKGSNLKYHEYWSGYETAAVYGDRSCARDSGCAFTYDCDPYEVYVDDSYTDANGNRVSSGHYETRYHSCPYATIEQVFTVKTTLGDYDMGTRVPLGNYGFRGRGIPGNIPRGEPKMWTAAKNRLEAGDHGPVTKRATYDNYILASQDTILKKYSTAIKKYKKAKQFPKLSDDVYSYYKADKVYTVGVKIDKTRWNKTVSRFNAAFGSDLQGDLHVVIFDHSKIKNADEYTQALYAYWGSKELGKDALSKNTLVVFLGTSDGVEVDWADAKTGMPLGNTQLLQEIRAGLRGDALYAPSLIGVPEPVFKGDKVDGVVFPNGGKLATMVWGVNKFERVSMTGSDKNDNGTGFGYLANNIQLTGWQKFAIFFASLLTSCIVWGILMAMGKSRYGNSGRYW